MRHYPFDTWLVAAAFVTLACHGTLAQSSESRETLENSGELDTSIVNVDVYYEALCSDSMRFIANQIMPSYDELKQHLNITFVPYGKASHTRESETGPWQFTCQHGAAECRGNKAHSCAMHAIQSSEEAHDHQEMMVKLVHCAMTAQSPSTAVPKCAKDNGLSEDTRKIISNCISGPLGDELLAASGDKTDAFQSPLKFVPAVVINGEYTQENQDLAIRNFPKLICQQLPENQKPDLCKNVN
ncbi:gamma-interferon-inducible lysosomal thiol reductase [Ooceraea biroi]|uniref:gamma-interferon-inducible lysosomal thiol reductase n=1 Tax=Ooceraea biroi TaxID=2015173 RepID=UPI0009716DBD|nr:gamma-interferon-inducible lysosomal thiol reductase [Ooceraea biroi]